MSIDFDLSLAKLNSLMEDWIEDVKEYMYLISKNSLEKTEVGKVLNDALNSSGKLIRPRLLLLCATLGPDWEKNKKKLCMLSAMVELTHLASLIHDDIIDDAIYRRGKKSVQYKYGKKSAVYAGDFFMARIYYYTAKEKLNESAALLSLAVENMCEGEIGQSICCFKEDVTAEEYMWNIKGKTAVLFRTACQIGALESGCDEDLIEKLKIFGENLGYMFQIRDDLLDFSSGDFSSIMKKIGKDTHKDFKQGIYTLPVILAMKNPEGKKQLLPILQENKKRVLNDSEIAAMEKLVIKFDGIKKTHEKFNELKKQNEDIINQLNQENKSVSLIRKLMSLLEI